VQEPSLPVSNTAELGKQKVICLEDCKVLLASKEDKIWLNHTKISNDEFTGDAKQAKDMDSLKHKLKIFDLHNCKSLWKFNILNKNIDFEKAFLFWQDFNLMSTAIFDEQTCKETGISRVKLINNDTKTTDG